MTNEKFFAKAEAILRRLGLSSCWIIRPSESESTYASTEQYSATCRQYAIDNNSAVAMFTRDGEIRAYYNPLESAATFIREMAFPPSFDGDGAGPQRPAE